MNHDIQKELWKSLVEQFRTMAKANSADAEKLRKNPDAKYACGFYTGKAQSYKLAAKWVGELVKRQYAKGKKKSS